MTIFTPTPLVGRTKILNVFHFFAQPKLAFVLGLDGYID